MHETRWPLFTLSLAMLLSSLGTSIANVALPSLTHAFSASFGEVQWVVLAYLLAMTTMIVSAGQLGDRTGRKRLFLGGIALFTIASAICGAAPSLSTLIAARALQGLGAAVLTALTLAFVADIVPRERTGTAMGLLGTMSAVGTALGPSLGGMLIATIGWRAIFFVNVPLALATLLLAWRFLPAGAPASGRPVRRPPVGRWSPLVMSALATTVVMATLVVGPFHLSNALALDAARVGLVMSCGPIVAALTGVPAGRLVDRFGARRMTVAGLLAMAAGSALLSMSVNVASYLAPLVVLTAGYALFQAANNTAVMSNVQQHLRGVVSGTLNLSRNIGLIAGASAMGAVFAWSGMRATFLVAAGLVVAALTIASRSRVAAAAAMLLLVVPVEAQWKIDAEARVRYDTRNDAPQQGHLRGILGAELRVGPHLRVYGEIGTGQVERRRDVTPANFQNDASLQQLFVDVGRKVGSTEIGAIVGRQEFAEGPRQLISVSDGPNLHRTWNGIRGHAERQRVRIGAFDLRATRLARGAFDDGIRRAERLQGLNASVRVRPGLSVEPFWMRSSVRNTAGMRMRGRRGNLQFDWTVARQTGDALGVFANHTLALSHDGWKPRATLHADVTSDDFHPLYASSNYLGEGQFLSLTNLVRLAPGIAVSPSPRTDLSLEYAFARQGRLLRIVHAWRIREHVSLTLNHEQFGARRYSYAAVTFASGLY